MEMLAANKMNLRRIFAAGWQEGESDAGELGGATGAGDGVGGGYRGEWRRGRVEATSAASLRRHSLAWVDNEAGRRGEFRVNKVRETCHAMESKRH